MEEEEEKKEARNQGGRGKMKRGRERQSVEVKLGRKGCEGKKDEGGGGGEYKIWILPS